MCNPSFSPSSSSSFDPLSSSSSSSYSYSNDYSYSGRRYRKPSLRSMSGLGSGTTQVRKSSSLFFDDAISNHEEPHYFLDSCFLCKTPLHAGDDIYMYRGDTPFCSEDCRQEQIDIDEAKERNKKKVSKKKLKTNGTSKSQSHELHVRAAETTVIASENY